MAEITRLTTEEQKMAEDAYSCFIAALQYIVLERKKITQVVLAKEVDISHNHLNAVLHKRTGKDDKEVRASSELQQLLAHRLGYSWRSFLEMGERLLEGFPVDTKNSPTPIEDIASISATKHHALDAVGPSEFRKMAASLAETFSKCDEDLKTWKACFEHLPLPALVVHQGIVIFQNARSRQWSQASGGPLCKNCYDHGTCNAQNCENEECPLCISINLGIPATRYSYRNGEMRKIDSIPFHVNGSDYVVLTGVVIDTGEVFSLIKSGDAAQPHRRKNDTGGPL